MLTKVISAIGNMKIRTKLITAYMLVVLLPILIIGYMLIDRTRNAVAEQTDYLNLISFEQVKNNIYNQFQNYLNYSNNAYTEQAIISYLMAELGGSYSDADRYARYFRFRETFILKFSNIQRNPVVEFYTSNNTIMVDEKFVSFIDESITGSDWYKAAILGRGGNSIQITKPAGGNDFRITFSRLIVTEPNKYTLVLKMDFPEGETFKLMESEGKNKKIYLIDDKNNIISSTDREAVGKNITGVSAFKDLQIKKSPQNQVIRQTIGNEKCVVNIGYYHDNSSIDGWKVVSIVSTEVLTRKINEIVRYGLLVCLICTIVTLIFVVLFSGTLTKRLRRLAKNMGKISDGRFEVSVRDEKKDEIGELTNGFTNMIERINSLIEEVYKGEMRMKDLVIKKKEAEIHALQSQINPHFLFNTMESIRMNLLKKQDMETAGIVQSFARLLRKSIDWSSDMIPLQKETELAETYLKIQQYRYRDKFDYSIHIEEGLAHYSIPRFSLQPIVENSIYHGIEMKEGRGNVRISAGRAEDCVRILVEDDGIGINRERLEFLRKKLAAGAQEDENSGIGIVNVSQRIKLHFGEQYGITVSSHFGRGTRVEIILPLKVEGGGAGNV